MSRYYRLLLDDYSAASFTSFSKDYYGTLEQIRSLFEAMKEDEDVAERQKYILDIYERYIAGASSISHQVAYREVPFLVPAKVLGMETTVLENHAWEHINTWGFPYLMKCDRAECTHIWFSCYGKYSRCIQVKFTNLQYESAAGTYVPLGSMFWGYPEQIYGIAACITQTTSPFSCLNNLSWKYLSNFLGSLHPFWGRLFAVYSPRALLPV